MKKIALLAGAAWVGAAVADAPANSPTGFYTGVNVGVANTQVKYTYKDSQSPQIAQKFGKTGMQYGLFGGYNFGLGGAAVVGAELFLGGDSTKTLTADSLGASGTSSNGPGKTEVKRTFYYGFAPRVGFMVTPNVLAYMRLGVEGGKWKSNFNPAGGWMTGAIIKNASKNTVNFAPGIGFDMFVSKNVFVRAQYHYVFGPKMTIISNPTNIAGTAVTTPATQTYKVSQQVFTLAAGFKF